HHHEDECDDPNCSCHDHEHHHHDEDEHEHHHHHHEDECDDPNCSCHDHDHEHHHHHHADDVFVSWGKETTQEYTQSQIEHILEELVHADEYGIVLRAKGIVKGENGTWLHFNYVPGEGSVELGSADYTGRYCVIGSKLDEEALAELFACED
ncbi:MAG: GTP-binding protein, partial [Phascolarctobacterium sp.]|nr:GTP-binding protein [Phascolarctobacterium sp.]